MSPKKDPREAESPFTSGETGAARPKDIYGQQVYRFTDFQGAYLYAPQKDVASLHLSLFRKDLGTENQAPPTKSQDEGHFEMLGHPGHGGFSFLRLTDKDDFVVPPQILIPLLAAPLDGLGDVNVYGLVHSHWRHSRGERDLVYISHWTFPGGSELSGAEALSILRDPGGEPTLGKLREIRRRILTKQP